MNITRIPSFFYNLWLQEKHVNIIIAFPLLQRLSYAQCSKNKLQKSHLMTKPTKWLCAQQSLRSTWASAQSDQSLLCTEWVAMDPSFLHADIENSDQIESSLDAVILLVLSWGGSKILCGPLIRTLIYDTTKNNETKNLNKKYYHSLLKDKKKLSRDMTEPTKSVCAQQRLRSAWTSAQSDQCLRCPHEECLGP